MSGWSPSMNEYVKKWVTETLKPRMKEPPMTDKPMSAEEFSGVWFKADVGQDAFTGALKLWEAAIRAEAAEKERERCAVIAARGSALMFPTPRNRIAADNAGHIIAAAIRGTP